jgi:hypothetical protein
MRLDRRLVLGVDHGGLDLPARSGDVGRHVFQRTGTASGQ